MMISWIRDFSILQGDRASCQNLNLQLLAVASRAAEQAKLNAAAGGERVDTTALAPDGSYGVPDFVTRATMLSARSPVKTVGKPRCGQRRSKNGGMKWRKVGSGQQRVGVVPVGNKSESVVMKRGVCIWKDWHGSRESQKHEPG